MKNVCNFVPAQNNGEDIVYYHFVYENNLKSLHQPFLRKQYSIHIVVRGNGVIKNKYGKTPLTEGTVFFSFPDIPYSLEGDSRFTYLYISFDGNGAGPLLQHFGVSAERAVYPQFKSVISFWMESIRRFTQLNASTISESVLMHTLSFIDTVPSKKTINTGEKFACILDYIEKNCLNSDFSVRNVADMFFYSEKYFSSLFFKKTGVRFVDYVNQRRIAFAQAQLREGCKSVAQVAQNCGFSDAFYFSKVFKKYTGVSPSAFHGKEQP